MATLFYVTVPVTVPDELGSVDVCEIVNALLRVGLKENPQQVTIESPFLFDDDAVGEVWE